MNQTRRHFTPEQKAQIIRRHLSGKEPVSDLADEFGLQPSQIHSWVKLVLDQAEKAFQHGPGRPPRLDQARAASSSSSRPSSFRSFGIGTKAVNRTIAASDQHSLSPELGFFSISR